MKKCASCTKDLPDAALHCVFCGAKQPPAQQQQAMAKTAFGYSANDVQDQLRKGSAPRPPQPAPGFPPPSAPGFPPPRPPSFQPMAMAPTAVPPPPPSSQPMAMAPTVVPPPPRSSAPMAMAATQAVPAYQGGPQAPQSPMAYAPTAIPQQTPPAAPGFAPASNAGAATLYVQQPGPPAPSFGRPAPLQPTIVPAPLQPMVPPMPIAMPQPQPQHAMPIPMAIPAAMPQPYQTSPTATNVRRPIDPWRDSLRAMMFIWGALLLVAFATPLATKPELRFAWKAILDGAGLGMLPPLMIAAVGLLSLTLAFVPMPTAARGVLATLLGLAGIAVPLGLAEHLPPWQALASMAGVLVLVPALIVRSEYLAAFVARLLVTAGVIAILLPYVLPDHGTIPLVALLKALIDLPGSAKVGPALSLGFITLIVLSLLAWLPSPATGAAKLWAWLIILWTLVMQVTGLVLAGGIVDKITAAPNDALVSWIYGGAHGALGAAYVVLVGYGLACAVGKQLE